MSDKIWVPQRHHRTGSCGDNFCEHETCLRWREIAASPCSLCRAVIGWGVWILDERSDAQRDASIWFVGFTHYNCRSRFRHRMHPKAVERPTRDYKDYYRPLVPGHLLHVPVIEAFDDDEDE